MAVTFNVVRRVVSDNAIRITGTVTGPASYTTGGETLSAAQIKLLTDGDSSTALSASGPYSFDSEVEPANFRSLVLDRTNKKLLFTAGATQVTSTTDLHLLSIAFEAIVRVANTGAGVTV